MSKYDRTMLATAFIWSDHGTCSRLKVACVIARDERILVQGYNGAPKGLPHCNHECDCGVAEYIKENGRFGSAAISYTKHMDWCASGPTGCKAVHAEQNAITWAARIGVSLLGSTLYCTHQPCLVCARLVVTTGIERVVYREPYRLVDGLDLLQAAGLEVVRYE